jgi:hypothetical protein
MASLITERMRFLHVPKTGGSFATAAMLAAGVPADRPGSVPFHADLSAACDYADRVMAVHHRPDDLDCGAAPHVGEIERRLLGVQFRDRPLVHGSRQS